MLGPASDKLKNTNKQLRFDCTPSKRIICFRPLTSLLTNVIFQCRNSLYSHNVPLCSKLFPAIRFEFYFTITRLVVHLWGESKAHDV